MSLLTAFALAAQAVAAPAAAPVSSPPPAVPMAVAKARVDKVKALLGVATSGDSTALAPLLAANASANMNGTASSLTAAALAPLKACIRQGPFTVNDDQVIFNMTCAAVLPAQSNVMVGFLGEQVSTIVAGPAPPPVSGAN